MTMKRLKKKVYTNASVHFVLFVSMRPSTITREREREKKKVITFVLS